MDNIQYYKSKQDSLYFSTKCENTNVNFDRGKLSTIEFRFFFKELIPKWRSSYLMTFLNLKNGLRSYFPYAYKCYSSMKQQRFD